MSETGRSLFGPMKESYDMREDLSTKKPPKIYVIPFGSPTVTPCTEPGQTCR
jgi:hypothetical protein